MADVKITALTAISSNPVNPATFPIPMVDLLDNTITASGTTKKVTVNQILGAGGTATLASATITGAATVGTTLGVTGVSTLASAVVTGDLTVDTSVLKVNSTTNKVGVNTTNLTNDLTVQTSTAKGGIHLNFSGSTFGLIGIVDPGVTSNNTIIGSVSNNSLELMTNNSTKATLDPSGNLALANGNLVMSTSGKGIDFSAVTGGTGTATGNVLNDYEEGTFTPTVLGSTIAGTATYTQYAGYYTKVGNLVTVQVFLGWSGFTVPGTGFMRFGGLPFTSSSGYNAYSAGSVAYVNNIALTASSVLNIMIGPNLSYIEANQYPLGGGATTDVPIDLVGQIIFTITYRV